MHPHRTLTPSLVILFLLFWPALALADFQAGQDAYNQGDYATALKEWQPLAEQGDAQAQYYLGVLYFKGAGVPQDYAQAREWWLKAAAQGHAIAQFNLGWSIPDLVDTSETRDTAPGGYCQFNSLVADWAT